MKKPWIDFSKDVCFGDVRGLGSAVIFAAEKKEDHTKGKVRRTELPIYTDKKPCKTCQEGENQGTLENTITCARQELYAIVEEVKILKKQLKKLQIKVEEKFNGVMRIFWKEENLGLRIGAIATGGALGFVYGRTRRMKKRLIQATVGALLIGIMAYPTEASKLANESGNAVKKMIMDSKPLKMEEEERDDYMGTTQ